MDYLDIETSPALVWTYSFFKTYIGHSQIEEPSRITSAVIMNEKDKLPEKYEWDFINGKGDDSKLLKELVKRINKSDLVIMQNGDRFDAKVIQERLLALKLPPIKNLITLDTLKLSRGSFHKPSHKLDARSHQYGFGGKIKQDMDDCIAVAKGNKQRQKIRVMYNVKDTKDTRSIFWRELDYYNLPQKTLNLLRSFIREKYIYCVKCAARRQRRFEIEKVYVKIKNGGVRKQKWQCTNCLYRWNIKSTDKVKPKRD